MPKLAGPKGKVDAQPKGNGGNASALEAKIQAFQKTASGALQRALSEQKVLRDALFTPRRAKPAKGLPQ